MSRADQTLNTEPNDIAGNPVGGPTGNTAARPGTATGQPGGASADAAPSAPPSSQSLVNSEMQAGAGAVDDDQAAKQENKEADPADLTPEAAATYGGNFSNSTHGAYRDRTRYDNQTADANRGEFGTQSGQGGTHGGFGNQFREADYEPANSAEDRYYGGPGAAGPQHNAYRDYDGRDERDAAPRQYGFEPGTAPAPESAAPAPAQPAADTRNLPGRDDRHAAHQNDNGSHPGPSAGYAPDYGQTSLGGNARPALPDAEASQRNQHEDYRPATGPDPAAATGGAPAPVAPTSSPQAAHEPGRGPQPSNATPDSFTQPGFQGDDKQGYGSKGGSYDDQYTDSDPNSNQGSPARGDYRREDAAQSYGDQAREQNRSSQGDETDYGPNPGRSRE